MFRSSVIAMATISLLTQSGIGGVTLVSEGQPKCLMILSEKPTEAARNAAEELQGWLLKISGTRVPVVSEDGIPPDYKETLVLIGDSRRTAALGLKSDDFALEEIRIKTFPRALVIIGDDARPDGVPLSGTLWAVETFAEQILGVRVLWPGPLGEIVPKRSTLEVPEVSLEFIPKLRQRKIRNIGYSDRIQKGLDRLGWKAEDFKRHHEQSHLWFRFHRIGGSFSGNYGHAFGDYWERFHKEHPDWFALQPDGTRDQSKAEGGRRARLCKSNRGLIEQVARDAIAKLRANPTLDTVSISPNDGGATTFCVCEACKAWDAPDGEMIEVRGPKGPIQCVSLTDRFVRFYAAVGEIVARECPGRFLGAYAYSAYALPPVHAKLPPNVVIGFVGFGYLNEQARQKARQSWLKWSRAAHQIFLRPNFLGGGMGFPTVYVHRLAEDLRFCADHGMMFTDFDCCYQNWATDGLNYYVLAKLLWDLNADVDTIVDDYCRAAFGPAAEPIKQYFGTLEQMTSKLADTSTYEGRKSNPEVLAQCYSDEFLARCRGLLQEAERMAGEDAVVKKRIDFLGKALDYARIRRDWTLAKVATSKDADHGGSTEAERAEAAKRVQQLEAERTAWYQKLGLSWALNAPCLQFYGY